MKKVYLLLVFVLSMLTNFAQETPFVPGEIIVMMQNDIDAKKLVDEMRNDYGISSMKLEKCLNDYMDFYLLSFNPSQSDPYSVKAKIAQSELIQSVQFNHYVSSRETIPMEEFFDQQWHHVESGDHDIDSDLAWDITTGGQTLFGDDIVACVIEGGGANYEHEDLIDNHWTNEAETPGDGIDNDDNGYVDDYNGWNPVADNDNIGGGNHGTAVSSMIGSVGNNEIGVTGVNWNVKIMQVTIGSLNEANVIEAYAYPMKLRMMYNESGGTEGALVVVTNASWGIDNGNPENSPLWCQYYDSLGVQGILNCGATANNNVNIDVVGDLPTGCGSDYMVSVTATNDNDVRTFSGYGATTIDLGAPGEDVYLASNSGYNSTSGTSFASPCVAGAIALLYSAPCASFNAIAQADPQLGADMIRGYIFDGVDVIANLEGECVTGGRLNVFNSLNLMLDNCSEGECLTPFGVSFDDSGEGPFELSWNSIESMTSFDIRYREVGSDTWINIDGYTENSILFGDLPYCTEFEFQLGSNCDGDELTESEWSASYVYQTDGCCEAPIGESLVTSDITETSATFSWGYVLIAESYDFYYRQVGAPDWIVQNGIEETEVTISTLSPCSDYEFKVSTVCTGGGEPESALSTVHTNGCGDCEDIEYCAISSDDSSEEWIESIEIGTFINESGENGGYAEFTDESINLLNGGTYDVVLTPGFNGGPYNEYWRIWIDFNSDGEFEEDEMVYDQGESSDSEVVDLMTLPFGMFGEYLKMRVVMKYVGNFGTAPDACSDISYGEIEDYCVTVLEEVSVGETMASIGLSVYPNPATSQLNIQANQNINSIMVYDSAGRLVDSQPSQANVLLLDISDFSKGFYTYQVELENGEFAFGKFMKK